MRGGLGIAPSGVRVNPAFAGVFRHPRLAEGEGR